jgi:hypothetical protein
MFAPKRKASGGKSTDFSSASDMFESKIGKGREQARGLFSFHELLTYFLYNYSISLTYPYMADGDSDDLNRRADELDTSGDATKEEADRMRDAAEKEQEAAEARKRAEAPAEEPGFFS